MFSRCELAHLVYLMRSKASAIRDHTLGQPIINVTEPAEMTLAGSVTLFTERYGYTSYLSRFSSISSFAYLAASSRAGFGSLISRSASLIAGYKASSCTLMIPGTTG